MNGPISPTPDQKQQALYELYMAAFECWSAHVEAQARQERRAAFEAMPQAAKAAFVRDIEAQTKKSA